MCRRLKGEKSSLNHQIMTCFLGLIIGISIVLNTFYIYQLQQTIEHDAHIYTYELVKQLGRSIDAHIEYMKDIVWGILGEEDLTNQLKESLTQKTPRKSSFLEELSGRGKKANNIVAINIFGENGLILTDGPSNRVKDYIDVTQLAWYQQAIEADGKPVVSTAHAQNYLRTDAKWVYSLSVAIKDGEDVLGVVLIDMSYKPLMDMCNDIQLGEKGYVYIVSENYDFIYHPKQQLIYSGLIEEDLEKIIKVQEGSFREKIEANRVVTVHTLEQSDWIIVGVSYTNELLVSSTQIFMVALVVIIICILGASWVSRRMVQYISRPIMQLEDTMRQVTEGRLNVEVKIQPEVTKEIASLSESFEVMLERIRVLIQEIKDQERQLRKSELKILQSQINPHFLYNSLETIIWLGERQEHEKVIRMTAALAKFFRLSLSKGKEIIMIYEEVQHIKYYLEIQKIRYANKLSYSIKVSTEIYEYMIPKITLQPLIENALYHGIRERDEGGYIEVRGWKEEDYIVLEVYDNGKGMTTEQLEKLFKKSISTTITKGGVAVKNVQERLKLYFGDEYGLVYTSQLGEFTCVKIRIPIIEVDEYDT